MARAALLGVFFGVALALTDALQDGKIYQITSILDEKALTVANAEPEAGSKISLETWQDESSQKWLSVEAVAGADNYLLVPRRQKWDWGKFSEGTLKGRHNSLPDFTLALNVNRDIELSQEFRDSKPSQQWRSLRVEGKSYHLLKSIGSDRCLKNPGEPKKSSGSVFSRVKSATRVLASGTEKPKKVKVAHAEMVACNKNDPGQQWNIEIIN